MAKFVAFLTKKHDRATTIEYVLVAAFIILAMLYASIIVGG